MVHPTQGIESNEKHIIYVFTQSTITLMKELQLCKSYSSLYSTRVQKGTLGARLYCNKECQDSGCGPQFRTPDGLDLSLITSLYL